MSRVTANPSTPSASPSRTEVRQRLREIIAERKLRPGDRLPPSRVIAAELATTLSRIQAATADLVREGLLRTTVGKGTFVCPTAKVRDEIRILIGLQIPADGDRHCISSWGGRIASALLAAGLRAHRTINWIPHTAIGTDSRIPDVDALILMPGQKLSNQALGALRAASKPVFHYNAQEFSQTENFVSPDYFEASARISRAFLAAGRRHLALLVGTSLGRSVSNTQRCAGFLSSIGARLGDDVTLRIIESDTGDSSGRSAVHQLMQSRNPPDGIYAFGDPLAFGAISELLELGYDVPRQVSVVGGSGAGTAGAPILNPTLMEQPYGPIAEALLEMVVSALEHSGVSYPGKYIQCKFLGGGSTLPTENAILSPTEQPAGPFGQSI